jgi:hypothetical protein
MAPDAPEPPHTPHRGSSLPRWLEWTTAISALVISICSIGIAIYNANIESRLLKANSYPYLIAGVSDSTPDRVDRFIVEFLNNGVGPADERSLKIRLGGQYVTSVEGFIRAAIGPGHEDKVAALMLSHLHDNQSNRFIAAKDHALVFRVDKTPENAADWDLFDHAVSAKGLNVEFCYCSVFEECWTVHNTVRTRAKACVRDEPHEFTPSPRSVASPLPPS